MKWLLLQPIITNIYISLEILFQKYYHHNLIISMKPKLNTQKAMKVDKLQNDLIKCYKRIHCAK